MFFNCLDIYAKKNLICLGIQHLEKINLAFVHFAKTFFS